MSIKYDASLLREEFIKKGYRGDEITLCLWELTPEDPTPEKELESDRFYITYWNSDNAQVSSAAPADFPSSGTWFARGKKAGAIQYVANGRKLHTAQRIFRTILKEARQLEAL